MPRHFMKSQISLNAYDIYIRNTMNCISAGADMNLFIFRPFCLMNWTKTTLKTHRIVSSSLNMRCTFWGVGVVTEVVVNLGLWIFYSAGGGWRTIDRTHVTTAYSTALAGSPCILRLRNEQRMARWNASSAVAQTWHFLFSFHVMYCITPFEIEMANRPNLFKVTTKSDTPSRQFV